MAQIITRVTLIFLLLVIFDFTKSAVFHGPVSVNPGRVEKITKPIISFNLLNNLSFKDHPSKCSLPHYSILLSVNEKYSRPDDCVEYQCEADLSWTARTCDLLEIQDINCRITTIDGEKSYPDCCPRIICDKE